MTAPMSANDVLMGGGGAPPAKFETPGTTIGGRIVAPPRAHQEREYDPRNPGQGKPRTFPSGDPIYGLTVDVQTTGLPKVDADDTGIRRIYVEGKRLKDAIRDAVRASGAAGLEVGGELHVTFTGLGESSAPGVSPPKLYTARYVPATAGQANDVLGVNTVTGEVPNEWSAGAQRPPAPTSPAAAQPDPAVVAAALAALTPEQRAAMGLPAA